MSNDTIYRQAAINTVEKHYRAFDNDLLELIAFELKALPSAESEIVHCKDCKHWKDGDGVYRRGFDAESKCPLNLKEVYEGTFYCGMAERRTE